MTQHNPGRPQPILVRKEAPIAWMVLNRPEVRNALSFEMQEMVPKLMGELAADPEVRVIVVTGAGGRAFCAGADVSEFKEKRATPEQAQAHARLVEAALGSIQQCPKVVIAMVNGYAVGNGCYLALACDLRVAADTARMGITSARLGMSGGGGGASLAQQLVVDTVGPAYAKEMLVTGRLFPADRALRMGLVNDVAPAAELEKYTRELAAEIAGNAPLGVANAKATVNAIVQARRGRPQAGAPGAPQFSITRDYLEGTSAFLEKRKPRFTGE